MRVFSLRFQAFGWHPVTLSARYWRQLPDDASRQNYVAFAVNHAVTNHGGHVHSEGCGHGTHLHSPTHVEDVHGLEPATGAGHGAPAAARGGGGCGSGGCGHKH